MNSILNAICGRVHVLIGLWVKLLIPLVFVIEATRKTLRGSEKKMGNFTELSGLTVIISIAN